MLTWKDYARMTEEERAKQDIGAVNLACAQGLPGAEQIDAPGCLAWLDLAKSNVEQATNRWFPQFHRNPQEFENSEARFRVRCLITVLQRDMGVKYNEAKIAADVPFDTADSFIHGAIQGAGGTCVTLPVLYVAVGRRLDYPLKLVAAYGGPAANHLFARWDAPNGERFNIEATGHGLSCPPDDYYRTGRYAVTAEMERMGNYLVSKTPAMELAGFLSERALRFYDHGSLPECVDAFAWASALEPTNVILRNTVKTKLNEWMRRMKNQRPAGFPEIRIKIIERRYPTTLPIELECAIIGTEASEAMLRDQAWQEKWWSKMLRGEYPPTIPVAAHVDGKRDNGSISLQYEYPGGTPHFRLEAPNV